MKNQTLESKQLNITGINADSGNDAIVLSFCAKGAALHPVPANGTTTGSVLSGGSTDTCASGKAASALSTDAAPKAALKEGWINTERYGEVFVSPGGIAWAVQRNGDRLDSVSIKITKEDITEKPSAERMKHATAEKKRYNLAKASRTPPLQPLQQVSAMEKGTTGALN